MRMRRNTEHLKRRNRHTRTSASTAFTWRLTKKVVRSSARAQTRCSTHAHEACCISARGGRGGMTEFILLIVCLSETVLKNQLQ